MSKIPIGIDLGTTNSVMSYCMGKSPVAIEINDSYLVPSCISLVNGKYIVGRESYEMRGNKNTISSVKRYMGTDHTFELVDSVTGKSVILSPIEASSIILKYMKDEAEKLLGKGSVVDVTISVPAAFNSRQRYDTLEAGKMAGMNVVKIVSEPTAAGLLYGADEEQGSDIVVFDLGGGTFDVSLLRKSLGENSFIDTYEISDEDSQVMMSTLRVVKSDGNVLLGGDDIDRLIVENIAKTLDEPLTDEEKRKLSFIVERNKRGFTDGSLTLTVEGKEVVVTHAILKKATEYVFGLAQPILSGVLRGSEAKNLVLVGGCTKSEILKECFREHYPELKLNYRIDPDLAVGLGASIQTAITLGLTDIRVTDVTPSSIGVEVAKRVNGTLEGGHMYNIIKRNSSIPCNESMTFSTTYDNQRQIDVSIYQGDSSLCSSNQLIGSLKVPVMPDKAGGQRIKIIMSIDVNNILRTTAYDRETGAEIHLEIKDVLSKTDDSQRNNNIRIMYAKRMIDKYKDREDVVENLNKFIETLDDNYLNKASELITNA